MKIKNLNQLINCLSRCFNFHSLTFKKVMNVYKFTIVSNNYTLVLSSLEEYGIISDLEITITKSLQYVFKFSFITKGDII